MPAPGRLPLLTLLLAAALVLLAGCSAQPPFARVAGLVLDPELDELSGLAASRAHPDTLWALNDGGNPARLYAIGRHGGLRARFRIAGVDNTDWEDLAAFPWRGRDYLLVADTGDNGGLRRSAQLYVVEEPATLRDGTLAPAWSIAFRWPDGPRDCEAVAVDPARGEVLLISKRHRPPELFTLPLRPPPGLQLARRVGWLDGVPHPEAEALRDDPRAARIRHQVTAADLAPDGRTLAVLTYGELLLYRRHPGTPWPQAVAAPPLVRPLPWLPQAEALAWAGNGQSLYATGELSPALLLYLTP